MKKIKALLNDQNSLLWFHAGKGWNDFDAVATGYRSTFVFAWTMLICFAASTGFIGYSIVKTLGEHQ